MRGALLSLYILSFTGCPPKPIPVPVPTHLDMAPPVVNACPANVLAVVDESCDGYFTKANVACAHCPGGGTCYDSTDAVYCAAGGNCFADPLCFKVKEGM